MGKQFNIGVSGVARRVKQPYIGVSGVARKVKAGYIGVNGVARLFYAADWWRPDGISESNVIAAYDFFTAGTESKALINLNSSAYPLTKVGNVTFQQGSGFYFPHVGNLNADIAWNNGFTSEITTFTSCIVKYTNAGLPSDAGSNPYMLSLIPMSSSRFLALWGLTWLQNSYTLRPFIINSYNANNANANNILRMQDSVGQPTSGTIGVSGSSKMYLNGAVAPTQYTSGTMETTNNYYKTIGSGRLFEYTNNSLRKTIQAIAFYNVVLTDAQQAQVYANLNSL